MPIFYRGVAPGTYWHKNDARLQGFTPHSPGISHSINMLMLHILGLTVSTPYVSLTWAWGVARSYAEVGPGGIATPRNPGYIYLIDIPDPPNPLPPGLNLLDPLREVAGSVPHPPHPIPYQHEGTPDFLLGVVDPNRFGSSLMTYGPVGNPQPASPSRQLLTIVRALRDAEILACGIVPAVCITGRIAVH